MNAAADTGNRVLPQWWRVGGIAGILWFVGFLIGGLILQGNTPEQDASIATIRQYFIDDRDSYLAGDYILTICFVFFFLSYVLALGGLMARAEGSAPFYTALAVVGGTGILFVGAATTFLFGSLALGFEKNQELDDATLRWIVDSTWYMNNVWTFFIALFVGPSGFVILRTGVLWRWLGGLGLLAFPFLVISGAWPIDGDTEGVLAAIGIPGILLSVLFILISSVAMIMKKDEGVPNA